MKTAVVTWILSLLAIAVSAAVALFVFTGQVALQAQVTGVQGALTAGQLCLNWATFVDNQRRAGLSDEQIDRLGEVVFAPAEQLLRAVARSGSADELNSVAPGGAGYQADRKLDDDFEDADKTVQAALPPGALGIPDLRDGLRVATICGSAEVLRAAQSTTTPLVSVDKIPEPH